MVTLDHLLLPELTGKLSLKALCFWGSRWWGCEGHWEKESSHEIPWPTSERSFLHVCPWLNACWLKVEVDSLMDLEFCLVWARVHLWIDVIEITFEGRSLDLSWCLILSCSNKTNRRREEDRRRRQVALGDPRRGVKSSVQRTCTAYGSPSACFFREFSFLECLGLELSGGLCPFCVWPLTTLAGGCLKWQLVARNCLENLLVEHDVFRDCLM